MTWKRCAMALVWVGAGLHGSAWSEEISPEAAAPLDVAVEAIVAVDRRQDLVAPDRKALALRMVEALRKERPDAFSSLRERADGELRSLWRLNDFLGFLTRDARFVEAQAAVLSELARRPGGDDPRHWARLHANWVAVRRLAEARSLAQSRPVLDTEPIPRTLGRALNDNSLANLLAIDDGQGALIERRLALDRGRRLVVVADVACAFSRRAAAEIQAIPELATRLARDALWVAPPAPLRFADTLAWNRSFPSSRLAYLVPGPDWAFVDEWSTPKFFFLQNGKVVQTLKGWPEGPEGPEGMARLVEALRTWDSGSPR